STSCSPESEAAARIGSHCPLSTPTAIRLVWHCDACGKQLPGLTLQGLFIDVWYVHIFRHLTYQIPRALNGPRRRSIQSRHGKTWGPCRTSVASTRMDTGRGVSIPGRRGRSGDLKLPGAVG